MGHGDGEEQELERNAVKNVTDMPAGLGLDSNEPYSFKLLPSHNVPLVQLESEYQQENREPVDHPGGK